MKKFGNYFWLIFFAALIFGYGCSTANSNQTTTSDKESAAFAAPTELTATLTNGNVILDWKNNATTDGGNWVEFATPGSEFTKLQVFMSDANVTTFLHPNVAPQTTFIYHVQPFFGRPTQPVEIITGIASTNEPALEEGPLPATNGIASSEGVLKNSIRMFQTFAKAAPSNLTATLSSPTSVDLRWKDCASDEDGYLIEIGSGAEGKFYVCALLPADTTSFRKTGLPQQTKCYFRVRAFFYGKPSNLALVTTP